MDNRPERHDARGINFLVRHVVVTFDVIDAHGLGDSGLLIEIEHVALEVRIIDNPSEIAFEMAVINDVEPNQCAKQAPVRFDDPFAKQVATIRQALFHFVERIEQFLASSFVDPLSRCETGAVNAVVDILIKKIV